MLSRAVLTENRPLPALPPEVLRRLEPDLVPVPLAFKPQGEHVEHAVVPSAGGLGALPYGARTTKSECHECGRWVARWVTLAFRRRPHTGVDLCRRCAPAAWRSLCAKIRAADLLRAERSARTAPPGKVPR